MGSPLLSDASTLIDVLSIVHDGLYDSGGCVGPTGGHAPRRCLSVDDGGSAVSRSAASINSDVLRPVGNSRDRQDDGPFG